MNPLPHRGEMVFVPVEPAPVVLTVVQANEVIVFNRGARFVVTDTEIERLGD